MFSQEIYIQRREKLRKKFKTGLLLFLGNTEAPMNYPGNTYKYRQDSNFLYYFGLDHPGLAAVMDIEAGADCIYGEDYTLDECDLDGASTYNCRNGRKSRCIKRSSTKGTCRYH